MKAVALIIFLMAFTQYLYSQSKHKAEFATVGGKKMAYKTWGLIGRKPGQPVLVFEGGGGSGKESFGFLEPVLSKDMPWIMYDRAGLSGSEADTSLKTDTDVVNRLHELLTVKKIAPPYLLVGHSMGGPLIRLFTALYPEEVAGLVFVDPTNFMLTQQEDEQIKQDSNSQTGYIELYVGMLQQMSRDTSLSVGIRREMQRTGELHRRGYFKEYTSLAPLPDIPVTVMIAYNSPVEYQEKQLAEEYKINLPAWFWEVNKYRIQHYAQLIKNNTNSSIIMLPGYQHVIHHRGPPLVASTIAHVYKKCLQTKQ